MERQWSSRIPWLITSLALVVVVATAAWAMKERQRVVDAKYQLEGGYQQAFFTLVERVENMELLFSKVFASAVPMRQSLLLAGVQAEASAARQALASLPIGADLQRSHQFLAQAGDFSYMVAEELADGRAPDPEVWGTLASLKSQTANLMKELANIREQATTGQFMWTGAPRQQPASSRPRSRAAGNAEQPAATTGVPLPSVPDSLSKLDKDLQETPTLIYDGPFSDHNLQPKKPKIKLGPGVSRETAARRAVAFMNKTYSGSGWRTSKAGDADGPIPTYVFSLQPTNGPEQGSGMNRDQPAGIQVSRDGGEIIWLLRFQDDSEPRLDMAQAHDRAQAFLEDLGWEGFVSRGEVRENNRATFSFVRRDNGVLIYPEMIKITVSLADGSIIGYDSRPYWTNRDPERRLPQPRLSKEDALALANPLLEVDAVRLAVIPLPSGKEVLTYELEGSLSGDHFLTYYNAMDGREEMVLRVVDTAAMYLTQ